MLRFYCITGQFRQVKRKTPQMWGLNFFKFVTRGIFAEFFRLTNFYFNVLCRQSVKTFAWQQFPLRRVVNQLLAPATGYICGRCGGWSSLGQLTNASAGKGKTNWGNLTSEWKKRELPLPRRRSWVIHPSFEAEPTWDVCVATDRPSRCTCMYRDRCLEQL